MRRVTTWMAFLGAVLYFGTNPALAQHGRGSAGHGGGGQGAMTMPGRGGPAEGTMPSQAGRGHDMPMGRENHPGGPHGGSQMSGRHTVSEQITDNPKLSSRLESLLPAGTNLQQAAGGFKNLGGFVAATHVSHNLGIPLDQLKTVMTSGKSLGEAIHEFRPDVDHKAEAKKATDQAKKTMKEFAS